MDNLNSKKFIISLLLIVSSTVLVVMGKLDPVSWEAFVGAVGAGYFGVNLGSQYMSKPQEKPVTSTI